MRKNPGLYNLFGRNCATFVRNALEAGGVQVPNNIIPKSLFPNLVQNVTSGANSNGPYGAPVPPSF
jgi:hypothetical protein